MIPMKTQLPVTELKAYLPAKDFDLSKRSYVDLGFTLEWLAPDNSLACFGIGSARFLLQKVHAKFRPDYFMMHLLVPNSFILRTTGCSGGRRAASVGARCIRKQPT